MKEIGSKNTTLAFKYVQHPFYIRCSKKPFIHQSSAMTKYALLTGATSGIGYEMAKELADRKIDLILVARNEAKLLEIRQELQTKNGIEVQMVAKDLSKVENAFALYEHTKAMNWTVEMLINNAGVGVYGDFIKTSLEEELAMIELNVSSLVALSKLYAQDMAERRSGKILQMASLLSYLGFPYYSVYSATKAFVLSFAENLRAELEDYGITVTALCPGPIDTAFTTPEMLATNAYKTNKPIHPRIPAKAGVELLLNGKGSKLVGFNNWFIAQLPKFTPPRLMLNIKKHLASRAK